MKHDVEAYEEAMAWVRDVHPGASKDFVHINVTWQEWNAMRALLGLVPQVYSDPMQKKADV